MPRPTKKPPPPPVYELEVRRCTGEGKMSSWSEVWLLQREGAATQSRLYGRMYNSVADELAAWFASKGVAVVREDQPGECDAPGGLFDGTKMPAP